MASYVSDQDREADLSCPSKCKNSGLRRGVRRPAGGGLISRLSVPLLFCFPLAVLSQVGGGGVGLSWRGGCGEGGGVRTRKWGSIISSLQKGSDMTGSEESGRGTQSRFHLPSIEEQAVIAQKHQVDTLLFCPDPWALRHRFINQETGEVVRAR